MTPRHLLAGERVLHSTRPSVLWWVPATMRTIVEAITGGAVLALAVTALDVGVTGSADRSGLWVTALPLLTFVVLLVRRTQIYRQTSFTITTDRLLSFTFERILHPAKREELHLSPYHPDIKRPSLTRTLTETIAWDQYRDSIAEGGVLHSLFSVGTLRIRYGSADAPRCMELHLLPYAEDLKHYLDKIRTLLDQGVPKEEVPAFIAKPPWQRG